MSVETDVRVWADGTIATAWFDPSRRYRYMLERDFSPTLTENLRGTVAFIMLNPSTADALIDDPTLRRCRTFARSWGRKRLLVVNLFALRSPDPRAIAVFPEPVGPLCDRFVTRAIAESEVVVAAWGAHAAARDGVRRISYLLPREMSCLGLTQDGAPRHPLYVPSSQALVPFAVNSAA